MRSQNIAIKLRYLSLFAFLLVASVTLTACDSNKDEDTVVEVEIIETETETTVEASDPVAQDIAAEVSTGALATVVGAGVTIDTSAGAITQVTSTATSAPSSGGGVTTTSTSSTVAPLVNVATGLPTGQVAISVTQTSSGDSAGSTSTTQTAVVTPNTSNVAAIQVSATTNTGSSSGVTLNQTFNIATITASNQNWLNIRNTIRQQSGINFANRVSPNGETWGARIQAALAAGKRNGVSATLGSYQLGSFTSLANAVGAAYDACQSAASSVLQADLTYGGSTIEVDCGFARGGGERDFFILVYS